AGRGRGEARIVGEDAGLGIELADVDDVGADRARERVIFIILAAYRELGLVRHVIHPSRLVWRFGNSLARMESSERISESSATLANPIILVCFFEFEVRSEHDPIIRRTSNSAH